MRRIIVVEPMSRSAIWSKRMALMALAVTSIALLLTRSRQIELDAGMVAILGGLGFAVLALILALMAFARIWSEGRRGLGASLTGFVLASMLLALPAYLGGLRLYAPQPRDLTTDQVSPPPFRQLTDALPQRGGVLDRLIPQAPMTQRWRARAQVPPLFLDIPIIQAHDLARRAAVSRGLRIAEPPDSPPSEERTPRDLPMRRTSAPPRSARLFSTIPIGSRSSTNRQRPGEIDRRNRVKQVQSAQGDPLPPPPALGARKPRLVDRPIDAQRQLAPQWQL